MTVIRKRLCRILAAGSCLTASVAAIAQTRPAPASGTAPSTHPILRIESTMHTAPISRIGVDHEGRYLVTGSADKTARVWRLSDGSLVNVLRPPIGPGNEGRVDAVAISPDASIVACAGYTGVAWDHTTCIYIFDRARGVLLRRITGMPDVINDLSFSPDGRFLAAGLVTGGIRVCSAADGKIAMADKDYGSRCSGTDWDSAGRLVTSSYDGNIRLYGGMPDFRLRTKAKAPSGNRPYAVRFSPDSSRIAVGYSDGSAVSVLDSQELRTLYTPDSSGLPPTATMSKVCWSSDGKMLFAAGSATDKSGARYIRGWPDGGHGAPGDLPVARNNIIDLRTLPTAAGSTGELVFASLEPTWGVIDAADFQLSIGRTATTADYRDNLSGFQLSPDGNIVGFAYGDFGQAPARFNVSVGSLAVDVSAGPGPVASARADLASAATLADGKMNVADWNNSPRPTLNGTPLTLAPLEISHRLAIAPDRQSFLLGTSFGLHCFGPDGKQKWAVSARGDCWAVNVARHGDLAAAAFGDGTIRWFRMSDGAERLVLFPNADQKRWVLWTPEGYYDCSAGAEDLIGWHINRGKDQSADFFPASRFRGTYYRPDLVRRALGAPGATEPPIATAPISPAGKRNQPSDNVVDRLPPVVSIVAPVDLADVDTPTVAMRLSVRTPGGSPISRLRFLVDGRPVDVVTLAAEGAPSPTDAGVLQNVAVPIPARNCEISVLAANSNAVSAPATLKIKWTGTPDTALPKPKLYVLAIGVGKYALPGRDLMFPAKDATDFAAALKVTNGGVYREVETQVLTDGKVSRDSVLSALKWIQDQTTAKDVAMVFVAGHGGDGPDHQYYYEPHDFSPTDWPRTGVAYGEIEAALRDIKGKAILFVDTAGGAEPDAGIVANATPKGDKPDMSALVNDLTSPENGVVVFSASTGRQTTPEDPSLGNGPFTLALLEAVSGKALAGAPPSADALAALAKLHKAQKATVAALGDYIDTRIIQLTNGAQAPTITRPSTVPDFALTAVR